MKNYPTLFTNNPLTNFNSLIEEFFNDLKSYQRSFFDNFVQNVGSIFVTDTIKYPAIDIKENEDSYEVVVSVAGHNKDTLSVELNEDGWLIVRGKSITDKTDKKEENYIIRNIKRSSFEKRIFITDIEKIDIEKIKSTCKDGLLIIMLPKKVEPKDDKKKITVNIE